MSNHAFRSFPKFLKPEFGDRPIRYLEVGTWSGQSCWWVLSNLNVSFAVTVDPWKPFLHHTQSEVLNVEDEATRLLQQWIDSGILSIRKMESRKFWRDRYQYIDPETFDLIYLDGDHFAPAVLDDSVNAWYYLKPGGILVWDDYRPKRGRPVPYVKEAVDAFLACHPGEWEPFYETTKQIAVRKKKNDNSGGD